MQRAVDLDDLTATANDQYYIDEADRDLLYSDTGANPPLPTGLYYHRRIATTDDGQVDVWRPNARLVSSQERARGVSTRQAVAMARAVERIGVGGNLADLPTMGILGKNDCDNFALVLNALIARERDDYADEFGGDRNFDLSDDEVDAPDLQVGDRMKHIFQGDDLACGHHGATIVAQDGADDVTLEAHVSQDNQAPKFHIRQGAEGFIDDNNETRDLGELIQIRFLDEVDEETADEEIDRMERRFARMSARELDPKTRPEAYLSASLGLTFEPGRRVARERNRRRIVRNQATALARIRALVNDGRWSSQGKGAVYGTKTPSGVKDIKSVIAGGLFVRDRNTLEKLQYCRTKGAYKLAHPDGDRSQATTDLYTALSHLNPANPDVVTLTNELGTARGGL